MFEDGVCVDPLTALDERPNRANITFLELFARRCVDRLEVMDEGLDYATALLSELCAKARCPPTLAPFGVATVEEQS